jgi:hypothetical protein
MDFKIDYAVLLLSRDKKREEHVKEMIKAHPYFHIREAIDALNDWKAVQRIFIDNGIQVTARFDPRPGKYGRWASFIQWIKWIKDKASAAGFQYAVLAEDDVQLVPDFKSRLNKYLRQHPDRWYFRCGPYNSCLVVRCDKAEHVFNRILATGVDMPDDHWAWKSGKVLQHRGPNFAKQLRRFPSNINRREFIQGPRDPRMWAIENKKKNKT